MVRAVYAIGGAPDLARFDLDPVLVDTIEADYDVVAVVRLARSAVLTHRGGVTRIEAEGHRFTALDVLLGGSLQARLPNSVEMLWRA